MEHLRLWSRACCLRVYVRWLRLVVWGRPWRLTMQAHFARLAMQASVVAGSAWMFLGSLLCFGLWLAWGGMAGWTETVHLWPTSLLTWFTWVLVVLVQHSQTRQEAALQRKLDELIYAVDKADNRMIGLEKRPPDAGSG